jgi:5-methylcytosine-specific restriction endonuclease McrA
VEESSGPFDEYLPLFSGATAAELRSAQFAAAQESHFRTWKELCRYYGNRCLCCGSRSQKLTRDHVIPRAQGGPNSFSNLQPLCGPCNRAKGNRVIDYRDRDRNALVQALVKTVTG